MEKVDLSRKAFWDLIEYDKSIRCNRIMFRYENADIMQEADKKAAEAYLRNFETRLFPDEIMNQAYWDSFVQELAYEGKKLKPIIEDWDTVEKAAREFIKDIL